MPRQRILPEALPTSTTRFSWFAGPKARLCKIEKVVISDDFLIDDLGTSSHGLIDAEPDVSENFRVVAPEPRRSKVSIPVTVEQECVLEWHACSERIQLKIICKKNDLDGTCIIGTETGGLALEFSNRFVA